MMIVSVTVAATSVLGCERLTSLSASVRVPAYSGTRIRADDERGHMMSDVRADADRGRRTVLREVLRIAQVGFLDADTQRLVEQVQAEYVTLYGGPDSSPIEAGVFDPPRGAFFLGYVDDEPVAMGGWRLRPDVHVLGRERAAEIKRMYVAPSARRRGLGNAVLAHLEETARETGAEVMVLETGTEQPAAIRMYLEAGYELTGNWGHYASSPKSRCFGKRL
jgi:ribosomal protein S18 acetylase RimI-like enzyme